jgi:hypothetical protein
MNSDTIVAFELLKERGGEFEITISGLCMEPVLRSGDKVKVEAASWYFPGDIIVFAEPGGRLVAHRLLGTTLTSKGWRHMTRPDNGHRIDALHHASHVMGKLTGNISRPNTIDISMFSRLICFARLIGNSLNLGWRKLKR